MDKNFEILTTNYFNTLTSFTFESNSLTAARILDWNQKWQYQSNGFNDDTTSTIMRFDLGGTQTVSRLALLSHNLLDYKIYYNDDTALTFTFTTADTTTSDFISNSETSQFFRCATVAASSISIEASKTIVANQEKAIGYFLAADLDFEFERNPSADNYTPKIVREEATHKLSDGGTRIHVLDKKWAADIKYQNISTAFRDNLKTLYDSDSQFIFCPYGTSTAFDNVIFESVWEGNFEFFKYSDNYQQAGYSGTMKFREV
jgi:hypothetical protein